MRLLLIVILGVLLVTYAWGWLVHVQDGMMTPSNYTEYYVREAKDDLGYFLEGLKKITAFAKKPLARRQEFEL